jgi:4-amino-4-deoxy-L-arabinose transferase-like glycosyltransferase
MSNHESRITSDGPWSERARRILPWAALAAVAFLMLAWRLGTRPLCDPSETRYAVASREMREEGHWLIPRLNGEDRLDKPALYPWLLAVSGELGGWSDASMRLPSALAALVTVGLVTAFGMWRCSRRAGFLAGLMLATSGIFIGGARQVTTDMTFALFWTAATLAFHLWLVEDRRAWAIAGFAALGLALFTKGPVAVLCVVASLLLALWWRGEMGRARRLPWVSGLGLLLVPVGLWIAAVAQSHPEILRYYLWDQTLERFTRDVYHREKFLGYTALITLVGSFPWSLLGLSLVPWRRKTTFQVSRPKRIDSLHLVLSGLIPAGIFSLSKSQLPLYGVPILPPLALWVAVRLSETEGTDHLRRRLQVFQGTLLLVALVAVPVLLVLAKGVPDDRALLLLAGFGLAGTFALVSGLLLLLRPRPLGATTVWSIALAAGVALAFVFPRVDTILGEKRSVYQQAQVLRGGVDPSLPLYQFDDEPKNGFLYYLRSPISTIDTSAEIVAAIGANGRAQMLVRERKMDDLHEALAGTDLRVRPLAEVERMSLCEVSAPPRGSDH